MQIGPNRVARGSYGPPCHVPAVVLEVLDRVDASDERDRQLAEGREHEIVVAERQRGADLRGLLALGPGVDGQLALALQRDALAVEPPRQDHPAEELAERRGVEADVGDVADRRAVGREDAGVPSRSSARAAAGAVRPRLKLLAMDAERIGDGTAR